MEKNSDAAKESVLECFKRVEQEFGNGDGTIAWEALEKVLLQIGVNARDLSLAYDATRHFFRDGRVSYAQFVAWIFAGENQAILGIHGSQAPISASSSGSPLDEQMRNYDNMPLHGSLRWSTDDSHFRKRFREDTRMDTSQRVGPIADSVVGSDVDVQHYLRVLNLNATHIVLQFAECSLSTGIGITGTTGLVIDAAKAFHLDEETQSKLTGLGNKTFSEIWPTWYEDQGPASEFQSAYLMDTQEAGIPSWIGLEDAIFPDKFASEKYAWKQRVIYSSKWIMLTTEQLSQAFHLIRIIRESRPMYKFFNRHMYTGKASFEPVCPTGCTCPLVSRLIEIERSGQDRWRTMDGHNCMTFATCVFNGIIGLRHRLCCSRDATGVITCEVKECFEGEWALAPQGCVGTLEISGRIAHFSLGGVAKVMTHEDIGQEMASTERTKITMVHENDEQAVYVWRHDGALIGCSGSFWGRKIVSDVLYWCPKAFDSSPSVSVEILRESEKQEGRSLVELIENGCLALVRGSYFEECWQLGRSIQMRQHIADHHFWNPQEAINLWRLHGRKYMLVVSYGWLSSIEPDPDRYHLERLVCILRKFKRHYCNMIGLQDVAVALDFSSLWQNEGHQSCISENIAPGFLRRNSDSRSVELLDQFRKGLQALNDMYIDEHITALKLISVPPGVKRQYDDRGWTTAESALIDAKGSGYNKYSFDDKFDPSSEDKEGWAFLMKYQCSISPPISPESLDARLEEKRKASEKKGVSLFTSGKDVRIVPALYEKSFRRARSCKELQYGARNWGLAEIRALCEVLPLFDAHGLYLYANRKIDDEAVHVLCDTLPCMKTLRFLNLSYCSISINGVGILVQFINNLPSLRALRLDANPFCSDESKKHDLRRAWEIAGKDPLLLQL